MNEDARRAVCHLIQEGNLPEPGVLSDYGQHSGVVSQLTEAARRGGKAKVTQVWRDLCRAEPDLLRVFRQNQDRTEWTTRELLDHQFDSPLWAIPDLLPEGLCFMGGRPKVGKSWLGLQIAAAVGSGGEVLDRGVERRKVLYLALEDSPRRLQARLLRQRVHEDAGVVFRTAWKPLGEGGLIELQLEIERHGYQLVIVDTLSRAIGRADQMDISEMTFVLGNLQRLALEARLTVLMIDHHRKSASMDGSAIDEIMGSTAKTAVADAAIGLFKEQGKRGAVLRAVGREVEEQDLALEWDAEVCSWRLLGDVGEVQKDSFHASILESVGQLVEMGLRPTTTNIAKHLERETSNVSRAIGDLVDAGKLVRGQKSGREQPYHLPVAAEV